MTAARIVLVLVFAPFVSAKTIYLQQWDTGSDCSGAPSGTWTYDDGACVSGDPYAQKMLCDADNMALHFQSYDDTACTQVHSGGAASVATDTCVNIHQYAQKYSCNGATANATKDFLQVSNSKSPEVAGQSLDYIGMPSGSAATAVAQLSCTDDECVTDCSNNHWNINQCYNTTGGNSQIFLSCDESGISEITYAGSGCQGQGTSSHMDTAKCLISETKTSFINTCVTGNVKANLHGAMSLSTKRKATRVAASAVAQLSCTDTECVSDCSNSQWNINECYNTTGGNSQIFLSCDDAGVNGITYTGTDCQGQGTTEQMDVAKCLTSETNSSFINTCVSASIRRTNRPTLSSTIQRNRKFSRQIVV